MFLPSSFHRHPLLVSFLCLWLVVTTTGEGIKVSQSQTQDVNTVTTPNVGIIAPGEMGQPMKLGSSLPSVPLKGVPISMPIPMQRTTTTITVTPMDNVKVSGANIPPTTGNVAPVVPPATIPLTGIGTDYPSQSTLPTHPISPSPVTVGAGATEPIKLGASTASVPSPTTPSSYPPLHAVEIGVIKTTPATKPAQPIAVGIGQSETIAKPVPPAGEFRPVAAPNAPTPSPPSSTSAVSVGAIPPNVPSKDVKLGSSGAVGVAPASPAVGSSTATAVPAGVGCEVGASASKLGLGESPKKETSAKDLKLGTGGGSSGAAESKASPVTQPQLQPQPAAVSSTSTSAVPSSAEQLKQPMMSMPQQQPQQQPSSASLKGEGDYYREQTGGRQSQSQQQSPVMSPVQAAARNFDRQSMRLRDRLLRRSSKLTCPNPFQCGITRESSLGEAILSHPDLSIPALHGTLFTFLHPMWKKLMNAPCNVTAVIPSSNSILRFSKYIVKKYCGSNSRWSNTEACRTAKHMYKLDKIMVDNAKRLIGSGNNDVGNAQFLQMKALHSMMKRAIKRFMDENAQRRQGDQDWCQVKDTTVFLPSENDLRDLLEYMSEQAQRQQQQQEGQYREPEQGSIERGQGEQEGRRPYQDQDTETICEEYLRQKTKAKSQLGSQQQPIVSGSSPSSSPPTSASATSSGVNCPQVPWKQNEGEGQSGSRSESQSTDQQQPSTNPSPSQSKLKGEGEVEGGSSSRDRDVEGGEGGSSSSRFRVRPFTVSAFMQRAIQSNIAYHLLPFNLITSEMPMHLVAPTLLHDPMFVNLGGAGEVGSGEQQQQQQSQQQQPQQQQQQSQPQQTPAGSGSGSGSTANMSGDALVDVLIARAYGVTPNEVNTPFQVEERLFSTESGKPQSLHIVKLESGVFVHNDAPTSVWPTGAKFISPDIRLKNGVLHIIDQPYITPWSASKKMKFNGLFGFPALASYGEVKKKLDTTPGVTVFVPQDSALVSLVKRLPREKLQKLIKQVARYRQSVRRIRRMAEEGDRREGAGRRGEYDYEGESENEQQELKLGVGQRFKQRRHESKRLFTSRRQSPLLGASQSQSDSNWESESGAQSESSMADRRRREQEYGQLAQSFQQLKGVPSFDLAKWCEENQVDVRPSPGAGRQPSPERQPLIEGEEGEPINLDQLSALIQSHIFFGVTTAPQFSNGLKLQSLSGKTVTMECSSTCGWSIGGANVIFTDITAKNGVIHIIDQPIGMSQSQSTGGGGAYSKQLQLKSGSSATSSSGNVGMGQSSRQLRYLVGFDLMKHHKKSQRRKQQQPQRMKFGPSLSSSQRKSWSKQRKSMKLKGDYDEDLDDQQFDDEYDQGQSGRGDQSGRQEEFEDEASSGRQSETETESQSIHSCVMSSSRRCQIVDTLQLNPAWQSLKQSKSALFAATNSQHAEVCTMAGAGSEESKSYSRDNFSIPTHNVCYQPKAYVCRQGRLVLKSSLKNQRSQSDALLRGAGRMSSKKQLKLGQAGQQKGDLFGHQQSSDESWLKQNI